jgi:hypothetical protein
MKCLVCPLRYIGQTGTTCKVRYKEFIQAIRNNNSNSGYSSNILNTGHTYGTITDTMDILRKGRNDRHLNTVENIIFTRLVKQTYTHNEEHNPIFQEIHEIYDR